MSSGESTIVDKKIIENEELIEEDDDEEEIDDDDDDEIEEEDEEEDGDNVPVVVGKRTGRGLTLKTLLKEGVLEPGESYMAINYLGHIFRGDLLPDGRIRSQDSNKIFGTPSAWAIYCKKIVNPDKKSGCGWASVRYRGKKLDTYKNNWFKKKRMEDEKEELEMEDESGSDNEEHSRHEPMIVSFDSLGNRSATHDPATFVELTSFQAIGRMQPFNITMSSSAMAVIDVHGHLTSSEVVGYLAGQWDVNNHNLIISHAFPVRCRLGDTTSGPSVEQDLYAEMARLKLSLVGWYHTHPTSVPLPTIRDVDSQLDYEMKMKGYNDATYTPVLGIIVSPYQKSPVKERGIPHPNGNAIGYWVMPPAENKPLDYGRPMSMQFTVVQDAFIPKEALLHMSEVIKYYADAPDAIELAEIFEEKFTHWYKLKKSLRGRVPNDHFQPLVDFLTKVIDKKLPQDDPVPLLPPPSSNIPAVALPVPAAQLPPSTSISLVDKDSDNPKSLKNLDPSFLRSSLAADLIPIPSSMSSSSPSSLSIKEKENSLASSPALSMGYPDKNEIQISITNRPKSVERKTPPKAYSPLFQLPPPPLFSMDTSRSKESSSASKPYINEEKKYNGSKASATNLSVGLPKSDRALSAEKLPPGMSALEYKYLTDYASKLKRSEAEALLAGYFDPAVMTASKVVPETKERKNLFAEEIKKDLKEKSTSSSVDLSAWFAHAKALQDAFAFNPHERENPFSHHTSASSSKELSAYLSSPEFLASHWNPTATAAALHLSREAGSSGVGTSNLFHPALNFAFGDSKPTYHSDVPLLLKKQQEEYAKEALAKEAAQTLKDASRNSAYDSDRNRNEFKVPKEVRDYQNKHSDRMKHFRIPNDLPLKEPKAFRQSNETTQNNHTSLAKPQISIDKKINLPPIESRDLIPKDASWISKDPPPYNFHHDIRKENPMGFINKNKDTNVPTAKENASPRLSPPPTSVDIRIAPLSKLSDSSSEPKDHPMNLSESSSPLTVKPASVSPMDMTTFKIKRDMSNPEVRHFIEPSNAKKHFKTSYDSTESQDTGAGSESEPVHQNNKQSEPPQESQPNVRDSEVNPKEHTENRPIINVKDPKNLMEQKITNFDDDCNEPKRALSPLISKHHSDIYSNNEVNQISNDSGFHAPSTKQRVEEGMEY